MHARVTVVQFEPGVTEEATLIYRDSVVPAAKKQKGFKGALLLSDRGTGKSILISFWESEADMRAGETSGHYHAQIAKFKGLLSAPPFREHYEVTVQVGECDYKSAAQLEERLRV